MTVEVNGAVIVLGRGHVGIVADVPHECPACHRMTCFFQNRDGRTICTACVVDLEPHL